MAREGLETLLARAGLGRGTAGRTGQTASPPSQPLSEPIALASVYRFADLTQVDAVWEGLREGFVYRRLGHPNQVALEEVLARLEGAEDALACSSGMGALFSAVIAHLRSGDHIVAQAGLYGGTQTLLTDGLSRLGITCSFAPAATGEDFEEALRAAEAGGHRPRAMLVETVANPSLAVAELPALSRLAARRGLLFIVDNTYPARTSHRSLSAREREAAGACAGLVRLSVGTEDTRDILEDLDHALG